MKLLMIIAGDEYVDEITSTLVEHEYIATNIGSSGDFLQYGNTILMLGVEDESVDHVFALLRGTDQSVPIKNKYHEEVTIHVIDVLNHVKINKP